MPNLHTRFKSSERHISQNIRNIIKTKHWNVRWLQVGFNLTTKHTFLVTVTILNGVWTCRTQLCLLPDELRKVWRYQMGNQKPQIEGLIIQWLTEKGWKDNNRSAKHYQYNQRLKYTNNLGWNQVLRKSRQCFIGPTIPFY